jgi:hypothetical protein
MTVKHFFEVPIDSIPLPVFVVDGDAQVIKWNCAVSRLADVGNVKAGLQLGSFLQCLNSFETVEGCGHSKLCHKCVIRKSISDGFGGELVVLRRADMVLKANKIFHKVNLLISVNDLHKTGKELALLVIKDVTDLLFQKEVLPICMHCRKLRDGDQHWHSHEDYLDHFLNIRLSHCICETCVEKFYPELIGSK